MIRLQGKYRLTFPVIPAEIQFRGYGNDIESSTSITLLSGNRISSRRPKSISFDFFLPGDSTAPYVEVQGYQGPRQWLAGLDRLTGSEALLTIDELDLAWNVLIGPCDGKFQGKNVDFHGSIELPLFVKDEFITWSNQTQLLSPGAVITRQQPARPNTSGKVAKKTKKQQSVPKIDSRKSEDRRMMIHEKLERENRV
ncbi:hypothetical protein [Brevibacillus brevis]|uniref:hypothetical protein n=1 Tax=Brevibacillus brevis TaxID=1393 RepID=UPI0025A54A8E|nr:hypothetical protein [Brevibacillus brevis]WJQ80874.1 hypothetical protein QN310_26050 [Brevibacillus brevis]